MIKTGKTLIIIAAVLLAALVLTACQPGSGATTQAPKTTAPAPKTTAPAANQTTAQTPAAQVTAVSTTAAAAKNWPAKLVMGFLPNEESTPDSRASNKIHQKAITDYLGIPVEVIIAEDYNAVIETMRNNKTQIAAFGPFSYILAHERSGAEALVVSAKGGKPENAFYSSVFITQPDSGIKKLTDLKNRTFTFVDPASTSGNLVPRSMFVREFGVKPEEVDKQFKSAQFSGSHNNSLLAVANKTVDAGCCTRTTYENGILKKTITEKDVIIFAESDKIPNSPIAVRADMAADLKQKIKEFYLQWQDAEYQKLRNIAGYRYLEIKDSDYDSIREIAKQMNMKPEDLLK